MGKNQIKQQMPRMDHNAKHSLCGLHLIEKAAELMSKVHLGLAPLGVRGFSQKIIYRLRVSYVKTEISRGYCYPLYEGLLFSATSLEGLYEKLREAGILKSDWTQKDTPVDADEAAMAEMSEAMGGAPLPFSEKFMSDFEQEPILGSTYPTDYLPFELV